MIAMKQRWLAGIEGMRTLLNEMSSSTRVEHMIRLVRFSGWSQKQIVPPETRKNSTLPWPDNVHPVKGTKAIASKFVASQSVDMHFTLSLMPLWILETTHICYAGSDVVVKQEQVELEETVEHDESFPTRRRATCKMYTQKLYEKDLHPDIHKQCLLAGQTIQKDFDDGDLQRWDKKRDPIIGSNVSG